MATEIAIEVTAPDAVGGKHVSTCSCTCGWTLTTSAATATLASQVAARARANHLVDVHPRQPQMRTPVATPQVVRGPHGHTPYMGIARKEDILWTRSMTCLCGWESVVSERTPFTAEKLLRAEHKAHVDELTDRAPLRDYIVLLGLFAVIAIIIIAMATTAIDVST